VNKTLWQVIDPASTYKPADTGGYVTTDDTPSAATKAASAFPLSLDNPHFGFLLLGAAVAGGLWWVYEGKGSGAKVSANLGPIEGEVGAGIGKE
jgi:hypothetical protein